MNIIFEITLLICTLLILIGISHVTGSYLLVFGCPMMFKLKSLGNRYRFPLHLNNQTWTPPEKFLYSVGKQESPWRIAQGTQGQAVKYQTSLLPTFSWWEAKDPNLITKDRKRKSSNMLGSRNIGDNLTSLATLFIGILKRTIF